MEGCLIGSRQNSRKTVTVIGGGVAGMSAACALAEAGFRVHLAERRGYLGGRASSYPHPGVGEVIDNCQHALFGCCTNLLGFYRRLGVDGLLHWTSEMTMIEPGGRCSPLGPSFLPAPLHDLPKPLRLPTSLRWPALSAPSCVRFRLNRRSRWAIGCGGTGRLKAR
jgi:uncharacterized protein with NAD-binding domain and iron-sulfur cluster